jgi:hypothetical protein
MAGADDLHEAMKRLEAHLAEAKADFEKLTEDERIEMGRLLEDVSRTLASRPKR